MAELLFNDKRILEQRARLEEQYQKKHDKLKNSKTIIRQDYIDEKKKTEDKMKDIKE